MVNHYIKGKRTTYTYIYYTHKENSEILYSLRFENIFVIWSSMKIMTISKNIHVSSGLI